MTLEGVDVSNNNGAIAWERVAGAGKTFAICKATEGINFRDAFLPLNLAGCTAHGLARGVYHFARPSRNSAAAEAAFFVAVVRDILAPGDLVALDFEDEDLPVGAEGGVWALAWLEAVEAALGFSPLIYTYPSYVHERNVTTPGLARYPLWWASYDLTAYPPPAPWGQYAIWQYTANGKVPGIAGDCDLDSFEGPIEDLRALGQGGSAGAGEAIVARSYINGQGQPVTEIVWGGQAVEVLGTDYVDVGIRCRNSAGDVYHRSILAGVGQPWVKE